MPKLPALAALKSGIGTLFLWLLGGSLISMVSAYLAIRFIAPGLLPLEHNQIILFLPSSVEKTQYHLAFLTVSDQSANLVTLSPGLMGDVAGLSDSQLNLRFGRMIDQVITVNDTLPQNSSQVLAQIQALPTYSSPSGMVQKIRLWLFANAVSSSHWQVQEVSTQKAWEQWLVTQAQKYPLRQCTVGLVNATQITGLGRQVSNLIEQSGYQIIRLESQPQVLPQSQLYVVSSKEKCINYAQNMGKGFINRPIPILDDQKPNEYRADILLYLGQDIGEEVQTLFKPSSQ